MLALLTGCEQPVPQLPAIAVTASDYCQIAAKIGWDWKDTSQTISGIRREIAKWDQRCAK
jgi:hypothetical protein